LEFEVLESWVIDEKLMQDASGKWSVINVLEPWIKEETNYIERGRRHWMEEIVTLKL